jgi:uncharacterized protein (DUF2141 family)
MKTVLALAIGVLTLATAGAGAVSASVVSQQTGGVPMPPPPRPGSPAAEAAAREAPAPVQPTVAAPAPPPAGPASSGSTALSPEAAAAVASATSRPVGARARQTALLLELETARTDTRISVAIYRDADSFRRNEGAVQSITVPRTGPVSPAYVLQLPPGRYAIIAWQDTDGDGKPTRTRLGGVSEPHGYSRDARARFGQPRFEDAAFDLGPSGVTQRIVLRGGR